MRPLECPPLGVERTQSTPKRTPDIFGSAKMGRDFLGLGWSVEISPTMRRPRGNQGVAALTQIVSFLIQHLEPAKGGNSTH